MTNQADRAFNTLKHDLHQHFGNRLRMLIRDTCETAEIGALPQKETIAILMSALMREHVMASTLLDLTEKEFMEISRSAYRILFKEYKAQLMRRAEAEDNE